MGVDLRDSFKKRKGWWMEEKSTVPAMLPPDGLIVWFRRSDVETLMDSKYPHKIEKSRKVWYFNDTYDREIAETDDEFVVANPCVLWDHYLQRKS